MVSSVGTSTCFVSRLNIQRRLLYLTGELAPYSDIHTRGLHTGMTGDDMTVNTERESKGGFVGFLTTLPGILTAIAALITAGTGGVVYLANGNGSGPEDTRVVIETQAAPDTPTQDEAAELDVSADTGLGSDDPVQAMIDDCSYGDIDACVWVLETLSNDCYNGYPHSCNALYWVSPVDSDYEWYGGTCGGYLDDFSFAGTCEQL